MALELDMTADVLPETAGVPAHASSPRHRRAWWLRRMYTPAPTAAAEEEEEEDGVKGSNSNKPRWLRRLVSGEYALGRRWKISGATSRLAAGLRWKRVSSGISLGGGGGSGCAAALLDTVAFRIMYVVEAVVLGLALSCFFCCCGCQI